MNIEKIKNETIRTFREELKRAPSNDVLTAVLTAAVVICKTAGNQDVWNVMTDEEKESVVLDVVKDLLRYPDTVANAERLAGGKAARNAAELQAMAPEQWNELKPDEKAIAAVWMGC